ncbi:MAG: hypothetical protein PHO94_11795, partial [Petrimonas sp.]|nr:hypothetical protein [Petrimonas sp.]
DLKTVESCIEEMDSELGTGGMSSKIHAAEICMRHNVEMWIVNGQRANYIIKAMNGGIPFTKFSTKN